MTPKEKAEELVNRYAIYLRANLMYDEDAEEDAKECALIAVDEIIKDKKAFNQISIEYWEDVKQEIVNYEQIKTNQNTSHYE
jgi:hypothetical protein